MLDATKVYGWLLKLYPAGFREEYETPMKRHFRDDYREAQGRSDKALLWLRTLADLAASAPAQLFHELKIDLKHGVRVYRRRWLSAVLAVAALGLAIGASTGVFSVLNALLLRGLPFAEPAQLTELRLAPFTPLMGRAAFAAWSRQSPYLQSTTAFSSSDMNLMGEREAVRVKVTETAANFFQLLGAKTAIGRPFATNEDITGQNATAVISYGLWQEFFAGDSHIAGTTLHLNGMPFTVVGVASAGFDYPAKTTVWIPTVFDFEKIPKRGAFLFQTIGRLKPGVSIRSAQEMFQAEVRRARPARLTNASTDERNRPHLISLRDQLAGPVRQASWVLAGLTLLVLLTACANVAQLLLSRTNERRQELEVRAALGASRARLLQQLTTEALILTAAGALLGLLVAQWTTKLTSSIAPPQLATQDYTILDWRVLAFAGALAMAMALAFGVLPAWLLGRLQPSGQMLRSQPGSRDLRTKQARATLIAFEAALTLTLLTSSLAMGRTFLQMLRADLGFHTAGVVTLNVSLQGTKYRGPAEWQYYSEALGRLRSVPGVQAAGAISHLPLANNLYMGGSFKLDTRQTVPGTVMNAVTPGYFRAMQTRFLAGRDFAESNSREPAPPVVVNEAFAKSTGLGNAIVGRTLTVPWGNTQYRVIGLVATTSLSGPANQGGPQVYWPIEEEPPPALTLVARVSGLPEAYLARCRDAVRALDREVPIYDIKTLDQRLADALAQPRFYTTATLFLAALAVLLAAVGIYGTAAYTIAQRRSEMGIRMALGATYERLRSMMVRESLLPILCGSALGVAGSLAAGRYLGHLIEGAAQAESYIFAAAAGLFLVVGLVASWSATSRVLSIDPADAIRAE